MLLKHQNYYNNTTMAGTLYYDNHAGYLVGDSDDHIRENYLIFEDPRGLIYYYYPGECQINLIGYVDIIEKIFPVYSKCYMYGESMSDVSIFFNEFRIYEDPNIDLGMLVIYTFAPLHKILTLQTLDLLFLNCGGLCEYSLAQVVKYLSTSTPEFRELIADMVKRLISQRSGL